VYVIFNETEWDIGTLTNDYELLGAGGKVARYVF
jgi:hypothetical protein